MNDKNLMRLFMAVPDTVRRVVLTDHQLRIVKLVRDYRHPTITSRDLAPLLGTTVQSATLQLARLWRIGYLKRIGRTDESGGTIYHYSYGLDEQE